jgi:ATP-dependent Clp protease protease subunit
MTEETVKQKFNEMAGLEDDKYDRYDPVALLFKNRIIMVTGEVNQQMSYNIIAQLKKLEILDNTEEITMLINSPGGSIIDGLAIYDMMREIKCPIKTVGTGMMASMGSVLLAGGDTRLMTRHGQLMIHQGSTQAKGQPTEVEIGADFMARLMDRLKQLYEDHIGLTKEYWGIVLNRDTWLTAEQALKIGFIDKVVDNSKPSARYVTDSLLKDNDGKSFYTPERSSPSKFIQEREEKVAGMSAQQIREAINSDGGDEADIARMRPELAVVLSQFPEYWTEAKKAYMAEKKAKAAPANDDAKKAAPAVKTELKAGVGGPK